MFWIVLIIIVALVLILIIYLNNKKFFSFLFKKKKEVDKILLEDALKHLFDSEYNNLDCSFNSLSGYLSLKGDQTAKLISRLEELNLVDSAEGRFKLTDEGKNYALRIIRIHRLWERYLADNTGIHETDWHSIAEDKEHELSSDEINQLAAKLGNPLRDPHGDPIPSAEGDIHVQKGIHLNDLSSGEFAKIIHIEDEPEEIYAQISSLKLHPGSQINLIENTNEKVRFISNGKEHSLSPILASNITVTPIHEKDNIIGKRERLSLLKLGDTAIVLGLSNALRGRMRRRLLDFGIVPGTKIKPVLTSIGDDPRAYEIRGTTIALRKNQSENIYVKKLAGVDE